MDRKYWKVLKHPVDLFYINFITCVAYHLWAMWCYNFIHLKIRCNMLIQNSSLKSLYACENITRVEISEDPWLWNCVFDNLLMYRTWNLSLAQLYLEQRRVFLPIKTKLDHNFSHISQKISLEPKWICVFWNKIWFYDGIMTRGYSS